MDPCLYCEHRTRRGRLVVYVNLRFRRERVIPRMEALAGKRKRSLSYMILAACAEYLRIHEET